MKSSKAFLEYNLTFGDIDSIFIRKQVWYKYSEIVCNALGIRVINTFYNIKMIVI